MRPVPAMVEILEEREAEVADIGAKRRHDGRTVGLIPEASPGRLEVPYVGAAGEEATA